MAFMGWSVGTPCLVIGAATGTGRCVSSMETGQARLVFPRAKRRSVGGMSLAPPAASPALLSVLLLVGDIHRVKLKKSPLPAAGP
jgi:hypothetical protein